MNLSIAIGISTTFKGIRAVVTEADIKKGDLIEVCPVILIPKEEDICVSKTVLSCYDYNWDEKNSAFVLGYSILTNHSYEPNCFYKRDHVNKTMNYYALRNIKKGEEITINYNGSPSDTSELEKKYVDFKY